MILALLAAGAAQTAAVEAERAFADLAQREGQWTAFRAYAAPEALMFVPQPANAQEWLKDRKDPPSSVHWWPARSWVSCDGMMAANVGPALYGTNGFGSFTTIWTRQGGGGWKWLLDQGHQLPKALPASEAAKVNRASCRGRPSLSLLVLTKGDRLAQPRGVALAPDFMVLEEGLLPTSKPRISPRLEDEAIASGSSPDQTFYWQSRAISAGAPGARVLEVYLWDGRAYRLHLKDIHEGRPQ